MKGAAQDLLQRAGLYHRIKSSVAYDLYWRWADPQLIADQEAEIAFFRRHLDGLKANDLIFDIGANRGHKTHIFLRLGARVVAVDPDKSNQEALRESFLSYRLKRKPVEIVGKAVSERSGRETFWVDEPGSAKNTLNNKWVETLQRDGSRFGETLQFRDKVEVETVTLDQLIESYGKPFYIKVDVEGHEASVLRGLRSAVPYVSFEVNLPEFRDEARECVDLLAKLSDTGKFNYTTDCCGEMALPEWLERDAFRSALAELHEPSLEVFWRS